MIDERYTELKGILEALRQELKQTLRTRVHEVRDNNGRSTHSGALDEGDASESELQQDVAMSLTVLAAEVLSRVDEALARLANGTYGVCQDCDGDIPHRRLAALPFALRCRECQELHELSARRTWRSMTAAAEDRERGGLTPAEHDSGRVTSASILRELRLR